MKVNATTKRSNAGSAYVNKYDAIVSAITPRLLGAHPPFSTFAETRGSTMR